MNIISSDIQKETAKISERQMANALRALAMDAVQTANSGHPGMPMGLADVAAVLFNRFINISTDHPDWPDRDRFVLSAGHGSMLLYGIHHLLGFADMDIGQIKAFRQLGSKTAGHPEYGHALGIETTTGPLGQGVATAVGMALAERMLNARVGDDITDHYTYVIAGDGCLMEGISHEAIDFAGNMRLGRLILLWDDNGITIDGSTALSTTMDQAARFEAAGWHVSHIDGHDPEAIAEAIAMAQADPRPSMIACKTIIGFGAPNKQGTSSTHGAPLGDEEVLATRQLLGWNHAPFEIPGNVRAAWKAIADRGNSAFEEWSSRLKENPKADLFSDHYQAINATKLKSAIAEHKKAQSVAAKTIATRQASQMTLDVVNNVLPNTVGGSADLTGSNNTRTTAMQVISAEDYAGDYIHYGIREHGMAATMNGIALHGGFIPYGGTFLVFADYCRPAMRLSALMGKRVIYVMTHDSIGLGEDGPTHQPVEHLASLRAIPNLNVFRPADAVETAEAWELSLLEEAKPFVLCLSRQGLPCVRTDHTDQNLSARGAYVLRDTLEEREVTLIASGSEVEIALQGADILASEGIQAAVISAPCIELFSAQDETYRNSVLGSAPRIGIEAGLIDGMRSLLRESDAFIGMTGFGASAPAKELYQHFGITADATAQTARELIAAG